MGPIVLTLTALVAALAPACARAPETRQANPLEAPPVDTARVRTPDEAAGWGHRQALAADLDGDDRDDPVVLAADVAVAADGTPLWEDGHRWAVFVDDPGHRTMLYSAFVPRGHVEAAITVEDSEGRRRVLVVERTPGQVRSFEVGYEGPGRARTVSAAYTQVETWFPDLTAAPVKSDAR
jgi:hypothetical protein